MSGTLPAWGEDLIFSQLVADRYGFTQRERMDEASLLYFRARAYDPRIGRFGQKDPILEQRVPMSHAYTYARLNPVNRLDPLGLFSLQNHDIITNTALKAVTKADAKLIFTDDNIFNVGHGVRAVDVEEAPAVGGRAYNAAHHFDNEAFTEGVKYINDTFDEIANPKVTVNLNQAAHTFGRLLHAVHDFYSHSNYVTAQLLARQEGTPLSKIVAPETAVPVWDMKFSRETHHWIRIEIGKEHRDPKEERGPKELVFLLTSGAYPDKPDPSPLFWNHKVLNKDDVKSERGGFKTGSGIPLVQYAKSAAARHTLELADGRFLDAVQKNPTLKAKLDQLRKEKNK